MKLTAYLFLMMASAFSASCSKSDNPTKTQELIVLDPVAISKTNTMKVFVHYMVWFENKQTSSDGKWGWHWTMSNENPDIVDSNGKRQIASFFYPSIGPYASGDKNVIEYHLLLMKYAGIDGVIMDWYGAQDVNDYAGIRRNTEAVVNMIGKTGLQFSVCYEDQTLNAVVQQNKAGSAAAGAQDDMAYLSTNFFSKKEFIKINNTPLLLVFGPQVLKDADSWTQAFSGLSTKPCFLTLWNQSGGAGTNAKGEFAWVYMSNSALDNFYTNRASSLSTAMGSAYPGFKDFYAQGGGGSSLGWTIDYNNGATFNTTLQKAKDANMKYIQLVTWNDFGEGTMIEPTNEFGYSWLESVKSFSGVSGYTNAFEYIRKQYDFRVKYKANSSVQASLDKSFYYFVALKQDKAVQVLDSIQNNVP